MFSRERSRDRRREKDRVVVKQLAEGKDAIEEGLNREVVKEMEVLRRHAQYKYG